MNLWASEASHFWSGLQAHTEGVALGAQAHGAPLNKDEPYAIVTSYFSIFTV